jgi:glc operon protein GlcG
MTIIKSLFAVLFLVSAAFGIRGQSVEQAVAAAGLEVTTRLPAAPVTYLPEKHVRQAFVKGMPLLEVANYKVHASHRKEPGLVEIHTRDTDIIYMLEGSATLVTGGTLIDPRTTEPEEIRASESRGGDSRMINKGDVIIIPNGTAHWFKEVKGPINYYVVKVRSAN